MSQYEMWTQRLTWMEYDKRFELGIRLENMIPMTRDNTNDLLPLVYHCMIEKILGDEDMTGIVLLGDRDIVLMISNTNVEI